MCGHSNTIIVNGIETCRSCGMWRTTKGIENREVGPWNFAHEKRVRDAEGRTGTIVGADFDDDEEAKTTDRYPKVDAN